MSILKAPKTNPIFWMFHSLCLGGFVALNFISRQIEEIEPLEHGIVSAIILFIVNTSICLVLRELIHRFNWLNARKPSVWIKLLVNCTWLGFLSSLIIISTLGLYLLLWKYSYRYIFFMSEVYSNWMIMTIVLYLWAVIYVSINHLNRLKQLELRDSEMALELKQAQLNTLIGQLNPHFLFNGLNNIRSLMLEDVDRARDMLTSLSEILRYSLQNNQQKLQPLENEIDTVRSYIELASIQYEERLEYVEVLDEKVLACKIPPMLVQLLVENAIRHGIDQSSTGGELKLEISQVENRVQIIVSNPGKINQESNEKNKKQSTGLGLENIRQRLHLLYGDEASFGISEENNVVTSVIELPMTGGSQ
ncbi:sensor histidine kinase [Aliikangiella coralliicola]|uniref:GHKL domain-containing protein n=1 Tax=Aliikangiella coralliicola TaxID=2592383 RepID=A0A545UC73_9GAMM|nr:histidine kinase [Aliikangiella coralliicola]TQV87065.1 GHKL domain-containing protein [Aliikangiella coralliicola]